MSPLFVFAVVLLAASLTEGTALFNFEYSKHPHVRNYDLRVQGDQVLIYLVLSKISACKCLQICSRSTIHYKFLKGLNYRIIFNFFTLEIEVKLN